MFDAVFLREAIRKYSRIIHTCLAAWIVFLCALWAWFGWMEHPKASTDMLLMALAFGPMVPLAILIEWLDRIIMKRKVDEILRRRN